MSGITITRRGLLAGTGAVCATMALGGAGKALAGNNSLLRPPGGQDEADFIGKCIHCDRCWSICPLACIKRADFSDGVLNARTPTMDFHKGYCDFCNKCIEVCPTGALSAFDPEKDYMGIAHIDTDTCLSYVRNACDKCFDVCRYEGLIISQDNHPIIIPEKCNGCGECVYACNVNIYGSFDGNRKRAVEVERTER